jgi:hypothetical protein
MTPDMDSKMKSFNSLEPECSTAEIPENFTDAPLRPVVVKKTDANSASAEFGANAEYSATEVRQILQALFPTRRLVLSQFTFFNQVGISCPTGETFRRGRRCYRLQDLLSIACVLALKEEGIPFKNIESLPAMIREHSNRIFECPTGCRAVGYGEAVVLQFPGQTAALEVVDQFLNDGGKAKLFWSYDLGRLASTLELIATSPNFEYQVPVEVETGERVAA